MSWLSPMMAWFALLIPAVVILWFLKLKRQNVEISSTLLWLRVLADKRVNSPFQRLRRSLLLLFQLLVILLLTAALTQPVKRGEQLAGRVHLLLIDTSASMNADAGEGSRLELAKEKCRQRIENMGPEETAVIIAFGLGAKSLTPVTSDRSVLRRALSKIEAGVTETRIGPAMELAMSIAIRQSDAVAVIYSDGCFEPWEGKQIALPVEYEPLGISAENSGIIALAARTEFSKAASLRVFVEVRNLGQTPISGLLSLKLGDTPVRVAESAALSPGKRWPHTFELTGDRGGSGEILEVVWEPDGTDLLEADNRAWIVIEPPTNLHMWQVGPPNFALDDALSVLPHLTVERLDQAEAKDRLERPGTELPDVFLWDRVSPAVLPSNSAHLFLGALPPGIWDPEPQLVERPPIVSWDREHPLNRFIRYSFLDGAIPEAWVLPQVPLSRSLLDSRGGGLIRTFRQDSAEGIVVAFNVTETRWPLQPSFPFFLQAAIETLGRPIQTAQSVKPESLISFEGEPGVSKYTMTNPSGVSIEVPSGADGWFRSTSTDELGLYRITWKDPITTSESGDVTERARVVPVSLLSLRESTIEPKAVVEIAGSSVTEESVNRSLIQKDYWPWLLAIGIFFFLGEWYLYHRR